MINKEPTIIIGGIAEIVRAVIPMLLIFGIVHWTDPQTGAVIFFVGVLIGFAEKLFTRSQTVSTQTANSQITTALRLPEGTSVEAVIAKTERDSK